MGEKQDNLVLKTAQHKFKAIVKDQDKMFRVVSEMFEQSGFDYGVKQMEGLINDEKDIELLSSEIENSEILNIMVSVAIRMYMITQTVVLVRKCYVMLVANSMLTAKSGQELCSCYESLIEMKNHNDFKSVEDYDKYPGDIVDRLKEDYRELSKKFDRNNAIEDAIIQHPFISNEVASVHEYIERHYFNTNKMRYAFIFNFLVDQEELDISLKDFEYVSWLKLKDKNVGDRLNKDKATTSREYDKLLNLYEDYKSSVE